MALRIYFAGECDCDRAYDNWRTEIAGDSFYDARDLLGDSWSRSYKTRIVHNGVVGGFAYCGAHLSLKGHQIYDYERDVLAKFHEAHIDLADIVFAWTHKAGAGTYVELGYARAVGKIVRVTEIDNDESMFNSSGGFATAFCDTTRYDPWKRFPSVAMAWEDFQANLIRYIGYDTYLNTRHWKETRELKLVEAGNRCQVCNATSNLHVHHRTYDRIGREDMADLTVLCATCHKVFHDNGKLQKATA